MVYQSGRPEHGFVLPQLVVRVNSPHQIVAGDKSDGDDDDENGNFVNAIFKILSRPRPFSLAASAKTFP